VVVSTDPERAARFDAVARDVYEPLQRYLRRRATADDAADVLSDSLLTVWRRLDDVPEDDPLPWCYGVARRSLANHRRSGVRRERLAERVIALQPSVAPDDTDPQERIERTDPVLGAAMGDLTDAEREIVHLWAWERLEPREIALVLDQTPNAVSVALSRAKRKLAATLRQDRPPGGQEPDGDTFEPGKEA
jgi:RNA polymerase sigma-70 factor, ECF subfamily